jgi:hypothetical protein
MFCNWNRISMPLWFVCFIMVSSATGQSATTTTNAAVPTLVNYSGTLTGVDEKPLTTLTGVTFYLYENSQGGAPLWMEVQNVQPNKAGHYSVTLGSTTSAGLPVSIFASGEARWLGVQVQGQEEQPRVMLLAVPYALKAGDAATIGGLPPSAFMLAAPGSSGSGDSPNDGAPIVNKTAVVSGSGTSDFIPLWLTSTNLGNSILFQSSGNPASIGINTTTPAATLDVNGGVISRGALQLPTTGTANSSSGFNSQPFSLQGSAFNSSTGKAIGPLFQWQTEAVGNNTPNPAGTLNLLYGNGSGSPAETGLNIASTGQITFSPGQIFPGTGTITGVTAGTDMTGGGTSGNVTLNLDTTKVVTGIIAGTDLTGGGTGGVQTLNLDTTKVPQLGTNDSFTGAVGIGAPANPNGWTPLALGSANSFGTWVTLANTSAGGHTWNIFSAGSGNSEGAGNLGITDFTGTSTIYLEGNTNTANLTASGIVSGNTVNAQSVNGGIVNATTSFNLGGNTFAFGSFSNENVFVGFSGSSSATGTQNTSLGRESLVNDTTGGLNTAIGSDVLIYNTTGTANTASGVYALENNTTGSNNTVSGYAALTGNTTGNSNTAIGFYAGFPNAGVTTGSNGTFLGYFAAPGGPNENSLTNATAIGSNAQVTESNALVLGSIKGTNGANASTLVGIGTTAPTQSLEVDLGNSLVRGANNYLNTGDTASLFLGDTNSFIQATFGTGLTLGVYQVPAAVRINQSSGFVGIGTVSPDSLLSVNGTADKPGGGSWGTFSDARLKTLHGTFDAGLSQLLKLHPIRYRYKDDNAMGIRDRDEHVGFVAQDVQRVIPEAVTENNKGYLLVNNDPILWTMLNAIKEQQREIVGLRAQLRMRATSTKSAATGAADRGTDRELRTVRQQMNQLRNKNGRLEARLARMERALDLLGSANTLALASSTTTQERK